MPMIYKDIGDTINHTTFELRVPDDYEPVVPGYYLKFPERKPVYTSESRYCYTQLPIVRIIDMCVNNIPFTIVHADDVVLICKLLQQYVTALKGVTPHGSPDNHPNNVWIRRAINTLRILDEHGEMANSEIVNRRILEETPDLSTVLNNLGQIF